MTASSSYNVFHGPYLARLHRSRTGRYMGAWVARIRNANQYLQIALGRPMKITGIATQGRHDANQWVTRYLVAFSQDNMHFEYYMEYGNFKVCCWVTKREARQLSLPKLIFTSHVWSDQTSVRKLRSYTCLVKDSTVWETVQREICFTQPYVS